MKYIYNFIPTKRKVARDVSVREKKRKEVNSLVFLIINSRRRANG